MNNLIFILSLELLLLTLLFLRYFLLQMVMAVFAYIYHQSFVMPQSFSVQVILEQV